MRCPWMRPFRSASGLRLAIDSFLIADGVNKVAFAHFTLATKDVDRSRNFFAAALGWQPIDRPVDIPMKAAWLQIAPGQELHLVEVDDFEASKHEREYGRHLALAYPKIDFSALKLRLVAHGAELIAPQRDTPFERFFFKDPNGYLFEVIDVDPDPGS